MSSCKFTIQMLCAILIVHSAASFFWGWGLTAVRRGVKYYICLSAENSTTTCFYCSPQQSTACTGIQGPPQQVDEAQAACLLQYCPATGRRRRSLISSEMSSESGDDLELTLEYNLE